jgi:glucosamine-6-phosphate deaminase
MIQIIRTKDYEEMSRKAANIIAAQITLKKNSVLGLATGSTPVGLYRCLVEGYNKGDLDFSQVRSVNLDEYQGLSREHDQSYFYFMNDNLFKHVNIDTAETYLPDGTNMDAEGECSRYHEVIASMGGVDLQLLGIGNNGHIGFNEPDDYFPENTHCVRLTDSTIQANARFFASEAEVPRYAYTMGIGEIMAARRILILASGKAKAPIIKEMLTGPVRPQVPASILRFHKKVTLVADEEALSLL